MHLPQTHNTVNPASMPMLNATSEGNLCNDDLIEELLSYGCMEVNWFRVGSYFQVAGADLRSIILQVLKRDQSYNIYDLIFAIADDSYGNNREAAQLLQYRFEAGKLPAHKKQRVHIKQDHHYNFSYRLSQGSAFNFSDLGSWQSSIENRSLKVLPTTVHRLQNRYTPYGASSHSEYYHSSGCSTLSLPMGRGAMVDIVQNSGMSTGVLSCPSVPVIPLEEGPVEEDPVKEDPDFFTDLSVPRMSTTGEDGLGSEEQSAVNSIYDWLHEERSTENGSVQEFCSSTSASYSSAPQTERILSTDVSSFVELCALKNRSDHALKMSSKVREDCFTALLLLPSDLWHDIAEHCMSKQEVEKLTGKVEIKRCGMKMRKVRRYLCFENDKIQSVLDIIDVLEKVQLESDSKEINHIQHCINTLKDIYSDQKDTESEKCIP